MIAPRGLLDLDVAAGTRHGALVHPFLVRLVLQVLRDEPADVRDAVPLLEHAPLGRALGEAHVLREEGLGCGERAVAEGAVPVVRNVGQLLAGS